MKKTMIALGFLSLLCLSGCNKPNSPPIQDNIRIDETPAKLQQPQVSDWAGHYKAFIPCEGCEKKLISIQLHPDQTYTLTEVRFFKQKNKQKQSMGKFNFDPKAPELLQFTENKTHKTNYVSWHGQYLELRDHDKNRRKNFEKYRIQKIHNIEVDNALKHVDIQADLFKTDQTLSNDVENTKLSYFFEIHNRSDRALKLKESDIVLVDDQNNEHKATIENPPIPSIQSGQTQHELVFFIYPESASPAYIKIK